jgi:RHS repeat-associated protein
MYKKIILLLIIAFANNSIAQNTMQTVNYRYHIRGGILGINLDANGNIPGTPVEADLFSYKLEYNLNGNIGKQSWRRPSSISNLNSTQYRDFTFSYDLANRLTAATYYSEVGSENYSLSNIDYYKNGNLKTLNRNGQLSGASHGAIDNLTYNYTGSRLTSVTDGVAGDHVTDLVPRNSGIRSYYDDGSLKSDQNKEIEEILYDPFIMLPIEIKLSGGRWIKMIYTGDGILQKREYSTGEYWVYDSGLVFKNGQPYSMPIPEGRANYNSSTSTWENEFFITDHLGNVRVAFGNENGNLKAKEFNDQDPYGLELKGIGLVNGATENRFKMQGKESVANFGLNGLVDFGARYFDKTIGVWNAVDPLALLDFNLSPYTYVSNNPIMRIDLWGLTDINYDGIDDGTTLNVNVEVRAKRTESDPIVGDYFINAARNTEKRRVQGNKYVSYSWTQEEIETGLKIEVAVATAMYSGSALVGRAFLAGIARTSAGRLASQYILNSNLTTKAIAIRGAVNLVGQGISNLAKGELKIDFLGFTSDALLGLGASSIVGSVSEAGIDFKEKGAYSDIGVTGASPFKLAFGLGFGAIGEAYSKIAPNGIAGALVDGVTKIYEEIGNAIADKNFEQKKK